MKKIGEPCILENRPCSNCGECELCDLDPSKLCDNCCRCINTLEGDYAEIGIDDILLNNEEKSSGNRYKKKSLKYTFKR
ncbi:hypothetical protein Desaci_2894 [Desulfosporosinus acidiphilus SJ4]|uniref:Uncharacterized protein n=1 Tax=Desulfosporosinus acidiphilus (strain DSM 22704 / JCM 16185 / SJ4) TaxID=646529 RepID=I4D7N2_DESAJ|nr:hypothetical protein [Desulfosporosinus acidiphilus]AFM41806.1 hypothetical protein Desaci_2894 [Desulfosporosinus acidiphilus SJ4]